MASCPVRSTPVLMLLLLLLAIACGVDTSGRTITDPPGDPPTGSVEGVRLRLELVASGLASPVALASPPGDTARLFVAEQSGRVRIVRGGQLVATPFLDITSRVRAGGEQGLLGLAFDPGFPARPYVYVNFTDTNGDTHVERFRVSADPNVADPASATLILFQKQPYANHNGGHLLFGPDGTLYIGLGDGGSGGDPQGNAQNLGTLLGKMLRIDVSNASASAPYVIPRDNPFVGRAGARGEIWASGLRNPWRYAIDPATGLLYIADVGQGTWEEIDAAAVTAAAVNYGWSRMEGAHCYGALTCDRTGLTLPVLEYDHTQGCSVIGGFVYRGRRIPEIAGRYFYSDYCAGWLRSFRLVSGAATEMKDWGIPNVGPVLSFGEDATGELYVLTASGRVYRLAKAS